MSTLPLSALIVRSHPEPASFSSSQSAVAAQALVGAGYTVDTIDLYSDGWQPVLARDEFPATDGPFKPQVEQMRAVADGTLDPVVQEHLQRLLAADLLVLSFPLWWFSVPAILKGWIDRVFVMGALFGGEHGLFGDAALVGKDAVLLVTTGGPEEAFGVDGAFGPMDDFLFHLRRGVLEFVGYRVLDPVISYGPARLDEPSREAALAVVHEKFTAIASGTPKDFVRPRRPAPIAVPNRS
jgi:NAD(P)H dehydrogenase (quinone)